MERHRSKNMKSLIIPVFVTYNLEFNRFMKLNDLSKDVIFVDNSLMTLNDVRVRRFNIVRNETNLGYGGGANVGMKYALERGAEWIIIMNQDLKITRSSLEMLIGILKQTNPSIVGPIGGQFDKRRWTTILPAKQMDYISGACIAIHRDVVDKIGYFFEPYFMYYEEADYCVRARKARFSLVQKEIKGIFHSDTPSLGKGSYLHQYYLARNHLLFVERQAPPLVKLYEFLRLPKSLGEVLGEDKKGTRDGLIDYLLRKFGERDL